MTSYEDIPPFFEPSAPPPAIPNLLAQTEVGRVSSSPRLLAQEELGPGFIRRAQKHHVRFSPYAAPLRQATPPPPSQPIFTSPKKMIVLPRHAVAEKEGVDSDSLSDSASEPEIDVDMGEDKDQGDLIPKPEGEAGRPGRGGYNLQTALGWSKQDYSDIKKYVKILTEEHLDLSKNISSQPLSAVNSVVALACKRYPIFLNYARCWPVTDLIRMELKYTSGRQRLKKDQQFAKVGKAATRKTKT